MKTKLKDAKKMYVKPPFNPMQPVWVIIAHDEIIQGKIAVASYNSQDIAGTLSMSVRLDDGRLFKFDGSDIGKTLFFTAPKTTEKPLTEAELMDMNGQPVWTRDGDCYIVNTAFDTQAGRQPCAVDMFGQPTSLFLLQEVGAYHTNPATA